MLDEDSFTLFEAKIYPLIWRGAFELGQEAKKKGLPRQCNLIGQPYCYGPNKILKVYRSAWEQGWDSTYQE